MYSFPGFAEFQFHKGTIKPEEYSRKLKNKLISIP